MPDFSFTGIYTEYYGKEGVLMRNKHIFANAEQITKSNAQSSCNRYHNNDNFYSKSKLTAQCS